MASWSTYHTTVHVTAGATTYEIPVDSLRVVAEPYSGTGDIATKLFDGRYIQRVDGWKHRVEMSWGELKQTDNDTLLNAVDGVIQNKGGDIDLDPGSATSKVLSVVVASADESIQAVFEGMVRGRGASVGFIEAGVSSAPKSWITN